MLFICLLSSATTTVGATGQNQTAQGWLQGWPMPGHDPQRSNRSPVVGPRHLHMQFALPHFQLRLVGGNGDFYGVRVQGARTQALIVGPRGKVLVRYHPSVPPLAISPSGILFAGGPDDGQIHAYSNGSLLWVTHHVGLFKGAVPLTTADDRLYAPFVGHPENRTSALDIVTASGQIVRRIEPGTSFLAAALGQDETIYAFTQRPGAQYAELRAFTSAGGSLWRHPRATVPYDFGACNCPLIGRAGVVYVADGQFLTAYSRDGGRLWRRRVPGGALAIAERRNGTLAVAAPGALVSLSARGKTLWRVALAARPGRVHGMSVIVDAAGTAYVAGSNGELRIVSTAGTVLAAVTRRGDHSSMAPALEITPNGRLATTEADGTFRVYG